MLDVMRGILSTVAVTSLNAYNFLSAGTRFPVCPITAIPISSTCFIKSFISRLALYPGMDSNLSIVPPVWPSPLPDIFAILPPTEATMGKTIRDVLSPTPPVLCLSTDICPNMLKSTTSPECSIA